MNHQKDKISAYFPVLYKELEFIDKTAKILQPFGFNKNNTIAAVCICRDEISQTFIEAAKQLWGDVFNLAGLGGMFIAGKMALTAAIHHAPENSEKPRYIFYALPHIAINKNSELGICSRKGIERSTACGALINFYEELKEGKLTPILREDDVEMSILKCKMLQALTYGDCPDLLSFTKIARTVIQKDLESAISNVIDPERADYALFTGIQVHGGDGINYVAPEESYIVLNNTKKPITI
ncbi:MAG: hypothetical protein N3A59_04610 [Thermodesulfovibrionales bacterium]|nr:hypothetical protein [Thermodesulfovibrionales bacterium]